MMGLKKKKKYRTVYALKMSSKVLFNYLHCVGKKQQLGSAGLSHFALGTISVIIQTKGKTGRYILSKTVLQEFNQLNSLNCH